MFNDKMLEMRVEYLEVALKDERQNRWELELKVARLMAFLGIFEEQQPNVVLKQKEK